MFKNSLDNVNSSNFNTQILNAKHGALIGLLGIIAKRIWLNDNTGLDWFQLEGYNSNKATTLSAVHTVAW